MGKRCVKKLPDEGSRDWLPDWQGIRAIILWYINWKSSTWNTQKMKTKGKTRGKCQCRKYVLCMQYCLGITWRSGKWFLLDCVHRKNLQNARVLQPVSMSATSKCMTDVWTFTTKTLTLEERLEQRIKMWKKLNEIRSSNRMRCYHQIQKNSWKRLFKKNQIIESFIVTCGIYWFPSFREI